MGAFYNRWWKVLNKLDKLLLQAKTINKNKHIIPVHIIENGYCHACKGKCQYEDDEKKRIADNVVVIIGDIPDDEVLYG